MNMDLFNSLLNKTKNKDSVDNFIEELTNSVESNLGLRQEGVLYQVVELAKDGVYLQNIDNKIISKETDITQEFLNKLEIDSVIKYMDGNYIYEESITQKFLDSLIDIKEYKEIQNKFIENSNILELPLDTVYIVKERDEKYSILSYENNKTIEVPNALIPFWIKVNEELIYKSGKFINKK